MELKCLALACSPRQKGNTSTLAGLALKKLHKAGCSTEYLQLTDFSVSPCRACGACSSSGKCVIRDDTRLIYDKILAADRILVAAPIYSMGINAQAKAFIDRAQQFWALKYLLGQKVIDEYNRPVRKGLFISCAGTDLPGVFDGAVRVIKYFFKMLEIELSGTLCYSNVDKKGEIIKNEKALAEVQHWCQILKS